MTINLRWCHALNSCKASMDNSQNMVPRNWTGVSCFAGGFFTNWDITEAPPPPRPGIKGSLLLNKKSSSVYQILSIGSDKAVVPNIFGTRDQFHGRQFFDGWGRWREGSGSNVNNGEWPLKLAHPPLTSCYAAEFLKGS